MKQAQHETTNKLLGVGQVGVDPLPVTRFIEGGAEINRSFWRPTEEELAWLNAGGLVVLDVLHMQPPVRVLVEAPRGQA